MGDSKGCHKAGRAKVKCSKYQGLHMREKNKLKRINQSNGRDAALKYAGDHGVISWFKQTFKIG